MNGTALRTAIAVSCLTAGAPAAPVDFYLVDSVNNLLRVDPQLRQVELTGGTAAQFTDIAFAPDERLFGVTTRYLYEIDPETGWSTLIGDHGFGDPADGKGIDSLTFDAAGNLYAAGNDILITIDPQTAVGTYDGDLSGYFSAGDLTVDALGRLVVATDAGKLVEAHRDGSGATLIGLLPYTDIFALATDAEGVTYCVQSTNQLVTIDPATGNATIAGPLSADFLMGRIWGGTIPMQHLPEPPTMLLCIIGWTWLGIRRARLSSSASA